MSTETWRQVPDWPYEVSDLGRVRRSARASGTQVGRVLTKANMWGYGGVLLRDGKRARRISLHRLVAEVFIGPPPFPDAVVHHLNNDPRDNRAANLIWTTRGDNVGRAWGEGCMPTGELHHQSKLTEEAVRAIRKEYIPRRVPARVFAERYGVDESTIWQVIRGETWTHVR